MFSKFNILEDEKYIYGAYGNYTSKHLVCGDCGADYVFSAAEQEFYASKDLSAPRRCGNCRKTKRAMRAIAPRRDTITTCVQCGTYITVPFVPDGTRPILCRDCFAASRTR
ncbi:MAG: zinc-ribbon domain containing protein [Rhodospirillaceae bacterium]|nr:zinc-ribbon domain containing protein [Rhodospirillales bacterium]